MTEMHDIKSMAGYDAAQSTYSTVAKSMQNLAQEMQQMSKESMDAVSQLVDRLRAAKTMEEIVTIQTNFMQESFSKYAGFTHRVSEMVMVLPVEIAKNSHSAFQQGADAMFKAGEQVTAQMQRVGEQAHHG